MNAADKNAPSEIAVNLRMTSTVPTALTQSKMVFPVSKSQLLLLVARTQPACRRHLRFEAKVMKSA